MDDQTSVIVGREPGVRVTPYLTNQKVEAIRFDQRSLPLFFE